MALVSLAWHRQGGIERCVWAEAEALLAAGVEVHVFTAEAREAPLPGMHLHGVSVLARPWIGRLTAFALRAPSAVAAAGPFDVVHAHTVYWGAADLASAHSVHRKAVELESAPLGPRRWSAWLRGLPPLSVGLSDRTYRRARLRHAISESVARELRACYPREADPTTVLYYGVDGSAFRPVSVRERRDLRRGLSLDGSVWALFCGWNWRRKGLDLLLRAMVGLPEARLAVVGEDPQEGAFFRGLARDLGLGARVRFCGRQADPAPWFKACDLFVFPTRYEPFGMVVTEAMACGLPVLVAEAAGACELIPHRSEQVLAAGAGVEAWSRAWAGLLKSAAQRGRMGKANLAVAKKLTWKAHGQGLLRLYASLAREAA